jgi:hypothetical protein
MSRRLHARVVVLVEDEEAASHGPVDEDNSHRLDAERRRL